MKTLKSKQIYQKKYYEANKLDPTWQAKRKVYAKSKYIMNIANPEYMEKLREYQRNWRAANKDKLKMYLATQIAKDPVRWKEVHKQYHKQWFLSRKYDPEYIVVSRKSSQEWKVKNRTYYREYQRNYRRNRLATDPEFKERVRLITQRYKNKHK